MLKQIEQLNDIPSAHTPSTQDDPLMQEPFRFLGQIRRYELKLWAKLLTLQSPPTAIGSGIWQK